MTCSLSVDQSFLPPLLRELAELVEAYPVWFKDSLPGK
jgi:hypothetical protein